MDTVDDVVAVTVVGCGLELVDVDPVAMETVVVVTEAEEVFPRWDGPTKITMTVFSFSVLASSFAEVVEVFSVASPESFCTVNFLPVREAMATVISVSVILTTASVKSMTPVLEVTGVPVPVTSVDSTGLVLATELVSDGFVMELVVAVVLATEACPYNLCSPYLLCSVLCLYGSSSAEYTGRDLSLLAGWEVGLLRPPRGLGLYLSIDIIYMVASAKNKKMKLAVPKCDVFLNESS
ncbi:hypothetical protein MAR_016836 [Mya arenaria]|uniref:Uncharacterized protein n=1 Tax=Mya arenaria TaxID=6604 RepID=A0ABY7EDV3_MYAAR|nr:hypothetical protein MAR_016836 [Mya arenaria]